MGSAGDTAAKGYESQSDLERASVLERSEPPALITGGGGAPIGLGVKFGVIRVKWPKSPCRGRCSRYQDADRRLRVLRASVRDCRIKWDERR
jgi:hypothetical protein